jgi:IclR family mhp operon transcriptional activator
MLVRETTDHTSPLAIERYAPGYRMPLLASASGLAFLAFCADAPREALLELLARSPRDEDAPARDRATLARRLEEVRKQGYAVHHRPRRVSARTSIAVPILADDRVLALLVVRYARSAIPLPEAVQRFVPRMREVAQRIAESLAADSPGASHG